MENKMLGVGLTTALTGSILAMSKETCQECNDLPTPPFLSRKTYIIVGMVAYLILILGAMHDAVFVKPGVMVASVMHASLLAYSFFALNKICPVCLLTASGAFLAAGSTLTT